MKKVLFVITGLSQGGAETQLVRLAISLNQRGYKVKVITLIEPELLHKPLIENGISVISLNMKRGKARFQHLLKFVRYLKLEKPDCVISFMFHANILSRIGCRLARVHNKLICSIRNENFGGPLREFVIKKTDFLADFTTTNSKIAADRLAKKGIVSKEKLRVIYNGLYTSRFNVGSNVTENLRKQLNLTKSNFILIAVGRLEDQKDYYNLLKAAKILADKKVNFSLLIIGQGYLEEELKAYSREMKLSSKVQFLGLRKDIPELISVADALVLSSAWEGLPNVVMEAMAGSKPVLATEVGGTAELIEDGINGYLVEKSNPPKLAEGMEKLMMLSVEERQKMGERSFEKITSSFDMEKVTEHWIELIESGKY
ncbi:glycosyltransferase [Shouchella clausii]|uniref:glycosyltransferase n=1 Tax=Shouchella clausii TaxID=79880 RepID=UPI000BA585A2|nr:glycosyltransferase [Shouchella clausii]MBX0319603.1 glycosyltransferase [Shouchella clausii]MCZ1182576.1 glycosyltransferase [Shouchella clausii]MDO7283908.1 glycosyltransferase [Shouchella clausii]MDO7304004.1 glycosyltransferase [Shouchella clausii]PAF09773.1 hypothetical protein CHH65_08960 [Shouchella clausii]